MSLETAVAQLTLQASQLLATPQALADQFTQGRGALEALYNNRLAARSVVIWVNAIGGSDANSGASPDQPLATLLRAVALIPPGGVGDVRLMSDITIQQQIELQGRSLTVRSDTSVRRRLTFGRGFQDAVAASGRQSMGFRLGGSSSLVILGLTLVVPPLDGNFVNVAPNSYGPFITSLDIAFSGTQQVTVAYCDIEQAATPFAALLGGLSMMTLYWFVNTLVGQQASMNGRVLEGVTNTAGTAPPVTLRTNLSQI